MIALLQADPVGTANPYQGGGAPKGVVMLVVVALLYALPSMLAWKRGSQRRWKITAINILLGWTIIGWIVAMVMTLSYEPPEAGETDRPHKPGDELED